MSLVYHYHSGKRSSTLCTFVPLSNEGRAVNDDKDLSFIKKMLIIKEVGMHEVNNLD